LPLGTAITSTSASSASISARLEACPAALSAS
jgi:hypothetical protein